MPKMTEARAAELIAEVGTALRERQKIEIRMNAFLAKAKKRFEDLAGKHNDAIEDLCAQLFDWAEANKEELLEEGSRTVTLPTGTLSWRTNPAKVAQVRNLEKVIAELEKRGLDKFLRTPPKELDKEAIIKAADEIAGVPGLKVKKGETFYVKPFGAELEAAHPIVSGPSTALRTSGR